MTGMLSQRTPRERLLLAAAAGMAAVWAAAVLLWQPLLAQRAALTADLARTGQLQARASRLPPPGGDAPVMGDDRPPGVIAAATAADMGLSVRRLESRGRKVEVTLGDAPFDLVLMWIAAVEADHGLRVSVLSLTRLPAPGTVAAAVTLERR